MRFPALRVRALHHLVGHRHLTSLSLDGQAIREFATVLQTIQDTPHDAILLRGTGLSDRNVGDLCRLLQKDRSVRTLDLRSNDLSSVVWIDSGVQIYKCVQRVLLRQAGKQLGRLLRVNATLEVLKLEVNELGTAGVCQLCCNTQHPGLIMMYSYPGVQHIAAGLGTNLALRSLRINSNGVGDDAAPHIGLLAQNTTIDVLHRLVWLALMFAVSLVCFCTGVCRGNAPRELRAGRAAARRQRPHRRRLRPAVPGPAGEPHAARAELQAEPHLMGGRGGHRAGAFYSIFNSIQHIFPV